MTKRIYAAILSIFIILTLLPAAAWASDGEDAPAEDSDVVVSEPEPEPAPAPEPEPDPDDTDSAPAEGEAPAEETPSSSASSSASSGRSSSAGQGSGVSVYAAESHNAAAARYEMSEVYMATPYYTALQNASLTGNQKRDILEIALSQVGYHERRENYTEYGRYTGTDGFEWCASFISWCAAQANISTSIIPAATGAYVGSFGTPRTYYAGRVQPGDIICFDNGDHVGLVYDVDDTRVYTVEGNLYDAVTLAVYAQYNTYMSYYYRPDYQTPWYTDDEGNWHFRDVNSGEEVYGWLTLGCNTYHFDEESGIAAAGLTDIGDKTYYFGEESNCLCTGWLELDDGWHFFEPDGVMRTGCYVTEEASYVFDDNGALVAGRETVGGEVVLHGANPYEEIPVQAFLSMGMARAV